MFPCHMTMTQEAAGGLSAIIGITGPNESSGNTGITLNYPGGIAVGDITIIVQSGDSTSNVSTATAPTGFTELGSNMNTGGLDMRTYYRVYQSGDGTSITVNFSGAGGAKYNMAALIVFRDSGTPVLTGTGYGDTTNTTVTAHDNGTAFTEPDSTGFTLICGAIGDTGAAVTLGSTIGTGAIGIASAAHTSEGAQFMWHRRNTGASSQTGGINTSASADSHIRVISVPAA